MDSREELPRISVGSVQDWNRLKTNYKAAALESLEERITTERLHNERDAMIAHANQFIELTFHMFQRNLRINGQNYELLAQDEYNTEPFDEALDRRIWSLADTRLQWQKRIAETRRTLPQEIESSILDLLDQQRVSDREETIAMAMPAVDDAKGEEHGEVLSRRNQMEEGLQKTLVLGEELEQTTISQEQRAVRVRSVTGEVRALRQ